MWSDMQIGRYISSPVLIPMLPHTLDIVTQNLIVPKSLHFEQNQAADGWMDGWMDGGGIRHPVPSSPHFLPNRYKLGMKSLAPCQYQSGTCSRCLPLHKLPPIPENRRNALPVNTGYTLTHRIASDTQSNYVDFFYLLLLLDIPPVLLLCLYLILNLQCRAVLRLSFAGWGF